MRVEGRGGYRVGRVWAIIRIYKECEWDSLFLFFYIS